MSPASSESVETGLYNIDIIRYITITAATVLIYEILMTVPIEIPLVWERKPHRSLSKIMYLLNRFGTLIFSMYYIALLFPTIQFTDEWGCISSSHSGRFFRDNGKWRHPIQLDEALGWVYVAYLVDGDRVHHSPFYDNCVCCSHFGSDERWRKKRAGFLEFIFRRHGRVLKNLRKYYIKMAWLSSSLRRNLTKRNLGMRLICLIMNITAPSSLSVTGLAFPAIFVSVAVSRLFLNLQQSMWKGKMQFRDSNYAEEPLFWEINKHSYTPGDDDELYVYFYYRGGVDHESVRTSKSRRGNWGVNARFGGDGPWPCMMQDGWAEKLGFFKLELVWDTLDGATRTRAWLVAKARRRTQACYSAANLRLGRTGHVTKSSRPL
ncbi:hypothetical protein DFH11DRAFT_1549322 [Phellopilus nigrolimitatus]|nr:hypothetical protein DFH11DRAFT_1549322 [Phellopilus nigrolimitatus]